MALILHLTDLHLGNEADDLLDDHKSEFIPIGERVTRQKVVHSTLMALSRHLAEAGEQLDAVVISGDITYANATDGFEALASTLNLLADRLPAPERTVVVPGNHDVKWHVEPSSRERYENFLTFVRARGYVTPMLDGVDVPPLKPDHHQLLLDGGQVQIVPINSANYCGVLAPFKYLSDDRWEAIEASPGVPNLSLLKQELNGLRSYDAARLTDRRNSSTLPFVFLSRLRGAGLGGNRRRSQQFG